MKRKPPKMRMAPAEPTQATDHDSSWCSGTEWSVDSKDSTDWWNIRIERRTRTPAHEETPRSNHIHERQLMPNTRSAKYQVRNITPLECKRYRREFPPDRMKQKEAGLRKKRTPLLRDMAMQMEPITIMVKLSRAKTAAARFSSEEENPKELKDERD